VYIIDIKEAFEQIWANHLITTPPPSSNIIGRDNKTIVGAPKVISRHHDGISMKGRYNFTFFNTENANKSINSVSH
jgi:hypothetical protein